MSQISSGVGLVSGLPITQIVDSLIAIQQRPITLLNTRIQGISATRTALLDLSARLLAFKSAAAGLKSRDFFTTAKAASSNENVLRATADANAAVGGNALVVRQLASTQQVVSQSFSSTSLALSAGTLTIESAAARLDRSTPLADLRGGQGVAAGVIKITDRGGASAEIDLSLARTVEDVLGAINNQSAVRLRARVSGDRIVIDDQTGLATGDLVIADRIGGRSAADLGLAGTSATGSITGNDLVYLAATTRLDQLNDGNGLRRGSSGGDFRISLADGTAFDVDLSGRINDNTSLALLNRGAGVSTGAIRLTNRLGASADVDLNGATTVGDVLSKINAAGIGITATFVGASIVLTDGTTGTGTLAVAEVGGGRTAGDLGLLGSTTSSSITGGTLVRFETLGDVLNAINLDPANNGRVTASVSASGDAIQLIDHTTGGGTLAVTALSTSRAAEDLGLLGASSGGTLTSGRLLAGLDSVLLSTLRGGRGVGTGTFTISDGLGATAQIDVTAGQTLAELIDAFNGAGTGIRAALDESGLGITLSDTSAGGGPIKIVDDAGTVAADLGIAFAGSGTTVRSGNLQRRYVSEATRLDQLDSGRGVPRGKFRITNAAGTSALVDLTQGNENTLQDVIDEINSRGIGVTARINDNGDGLLLTDTSGGGGVLKVEEDGGGTTARALRILGQAKPPTTTLDGSFETRITLTSADTLSTLVTKIRDSGAPVTAALIGDGSAGNGVRLSLTSQRSGVSGRLLFDAGTIGLSFSTLSRGRDAAVQIGTGDEGQPLIVTSSSNTVTNALSGLKLELVSASATPVTVNVTRDVSAMTKQMEALASAYNAIMGRIDDLSSFDAEAGTRGVLLGDRSADEIRSRMSRLLTRTVPGQPTRYSRLGSVGFSLSEGELKFDATKFEAAFAADPTAVATLFAKETSGLATAISSEVDRLADTNTGSLTVRNQSLTRSSDDLEKRKTQLTELLEARRARLLAQFQATEATLARLQSQQSALGGLSSSFNLSSLGLSA